MVLHQVVGVDLRTCSGSLLSGNTADGRYPVAQAIVTVDAAEQRWQPGKGWIPSRGAPTLVVVGRR
jgi:hypothetical protein